MSEHKARLSRDQIANVRLQARIVRLEREIAFLRQESSAGYARGQIKSAPRLVWSVRAESEDFL